MAEDIIKQLPSLISLLDDEDQEVIGHIMPKLISLGPSVIPALENAWESNLNPLLQERLEIIIHKIEYSNAAQDIKNWIANPSTDLLVPSFLASRLSFPGQNLMDITSQFLEIQERIWIDLHNFYTPLEAVNIFNQTFYTHFGFKGTMTEPTNSDSFAINIALEQRSGGPLMLGIIYLILAKRMDLPIYGVELSNHFVLAFMKHEPDFENTTEHELAQEVLFYINPVNKGVIFTKYEMDQYLGRMHIQPEPRYYAPLSDMKVYKLLLSNIRNGFLHEKKYEDAEILEDLIELI